MNATSNRFARFYNCTCCGAAFPATIPYTRNGNEIAPICIHRCDPARGNIVSVGEAFEVAGE